MFVVRLITLVLPCLLWAAGCGQDENLNPNIIEGAAGGSALLHVSDGNPISKPLYSWSDITNPIDSNTAMQIQVARTSELDTTVWGVISSDPNQNLIQSPWPHGTSTSSVAPTINTEPDLQTNIEYRVTVTKVDGTFGYREFTILP